MTRVVLPEQTDLVAGAWIAAGSERNEWIEHSSDGRSEQVQREASAASIESALVAAWNVHASGAWSGRTDVERAAVLEAAADRLATVVPDIAALESATTGAVIGTTSMLGFIVHGAFRLAAAQPAAGGRGGHRRGRRLRAGGGARGGPRVGRAVLRPAPRGRGPAGGAAGRQRR
ncbi:MAG: hypothetical protein FGM45_10160 [Actinobacteria bacterium]|nr:hypothetical protein [Actinomycetota bacterium]